MIVFSSKEKQRNSHRSKKKFFNVEDVLNSKEKAHLKEQMNNRSNNLVIRARQPSKQQKGSRSPSKASRKSKQSVFSDKDKMMTKQVAIHNIEFHTNKPVANERRNFLSPDLIIRPRNSHRQLSNEVGVRFQRRSKQSSKEQNNKRKHKFPKLFNHCIETNKLTRTPPRSPKNNFIQQHAHINPISVKQSEQIDELRDQNQYYKLIYKASVEKMKRLSDSIEKQKRNYKKTKQQYEKELKQLKMKVQNTDKKITFGHLYHYDQKQALKLQKDKIILQTDNQASQITKNNDADSKLKNKHSIPSKLSIQST